MEAFLANSGLTEVQSMKNIAFLLENEAVFSTTEYKILQSREDDKFIPCIQLKYNGKIKLFYMTSQYQSLSEMIQIIDALALLGVLSKLIQAVLEIKENGFLNCAKIAISADKIFVDENGKVHLLYIPIVGVSADDTEFTASLKRNILVIVDGCPAGQSGALENFKKELETSKTSLEELYQAAAANHSVESKVNQFIQKKNKTFQKFSSMLQREEQPVMLLKYAGTEKKLEFCIETKEYVLGKNKDAVDGVIDFNNAVSRIHCKVFFKNKRYYVTDLKSANGTFLNGKRLLENKPEAVKNGDILRLANCEFHVLME